MLKQKVERDDDSKKSHHALDVSFQEVVHSALTEKAEVAEASVSRKNRMDTHKNAPLMVRKQEEPLRTSGFVGWPQWPDNEDYSFEFMRVLATATEGASTVSECFWAARHIDHTDRASWYDAWTAVAAREQAARRRGFRSWRLEYGDRQLVARLELLSDRRSIPE
jgi:hypothetical protein